MSTTAFQPTLLESDRLMWRLASELRNFIHDLRLSLSEFSANPIGVCRRRLGKFRSDLRRILEQPNILASCTFALLAVSVLALAVSLIDRRSRSDSGPEPGEESAGPIAILNLSLATPGVNAAVGVGGRGRVGVNHDKGEGSDTERQRSGGGGSGGDHDLTPAQQGKLLAPSLIPAAIAKTPPAVATSLPVAGMDLDPALWRDMKFPVYGDPRSKLEAASNGPGDGGGMGTNRGTGVGEGDGPGFGPGQDGNMGGNHHQTGCCGDGASAGSNPEGLEKRTLKVSEVETRPRVISKPEPQYTEEARRNQMMGTVVLRVVFASTGEVTQIHAVRTLPFGLTEKAIAAARQIRFLPAMRGGYPVSVYMQLEYNFNLY